MEVSNFIAAIEVIDDILNGFLNVIIWVAKILFLTPWGWIIVAIAFIAMLVSKIRTSKDEITFYSVVGGITETLFWFYTNISTILIGLFMVFVLSVVFTGLRDVTGSFKLFSEMKTLEATLKNLQSERKVLEVSAMPVSVNGTNRMNVTVKYYAYSPVKEADVMTGEKIYIVDGEKLYVDFGVINFKYSLIEKGEAYNIAFPNRIFSDVLPAGNSLNIFASADGVPLTFKLDEQEIYILSKDSYNVQINKMIEFSTNTNLSRQIGVKTMYGEAIGFEPQEGKTYLFYSTGAGGVLMK
ncbi:MAG: hypothetical protein A2Y33_08330 [Spirochaetes bacterium GWF1_51_8]|nr:MAG: hypothetical protein A2Y33_08330 [Spirochaetes bacterium GWF1_51_8]